MSMKNTLTPAGIEPATFRFVVQHVNHCATAVPEYLWYVGEMILTGEDRGTVRGTCPSNQRFTEKFDTIYSGSFIFLCGSLGKYKACPSESGTEVGTPLFPAVELCDFSGRWQCMSGEIWYTIDSGSVLLTETEAR